MIYIVTEEGVYRHRILGIFTTQEAAEKRAKEVAEAEKSVGYYWTGDGYHNYQVSSALPDVDIEDVTPICEFEREAKSIFGKWELEKEATRRSL